jgi:hypothetical protein
LGFDHHGFQKKVAGIVQAMKDLLEAIPINIPLIRKHVTISAPIIVKVNGQQPIAEPLQLLEAGSVHILVTDVVAKSNGITAAFSQNAL